MATLARIGDVVINLDRVQYFFELCDDEKDGRTKIAFRDTDYIVSPRNLNQVLDKLELIKIKEGKND